MEIASQKADITTDLPETTELLEMLLSHTTTTTTRLPRQQTGEPPAIPIARLPVELLEKILALLDIVSVWRLQHASRRLRRLIRASSPVLARFATFRAVAQSHARFDARWRSKYLSHGTALYFVKFQNRAQALQPIRGMGDDLSEVSDRRYVEVSFEPKLQKNYGIVSVLAIATVKVRPGLKKEWLVQVAKHLALAHPVNEPMNAMDFEMLASEIIPREVAAASTEEVRNEHRFSVKWQWKGYSDVPGPAASSKWARRFMEGEPTYEVTFALEASIKGALRKFEVVKQGTTLRG